MVPLLVIPVGIFAFLGGAAFGRSRRGLSMTPRTASPLPGIPLLAWERFVTVMAVSPPRQVTPRQRMGMFGMDARRLEDVGFVQGAHKSTVGGELGVWVGKWRAPLTTEKFLASTPAQYEAFKRSCARLAPRVQGLVGTVVDGQPCSLSGLLGVGHLAGEEGVQSWVANPKTRARFGATTRMFRKTNNLF